MPSRLNKSRKVVGAKQTLKAIEAGEAELVYFAQDADEHVIGPIRRECEASGVDIVEVESMTMLGKACSIEVGAAVASVIKSKLS